MSTPTNKPYRHDVTLNELREKQYRTEKRARRLSHELRDLRAAPGTPAEEIARVEKQVERAAARHEAAAASASARHAVVYAD